MLNECYPSTSVDPWIPRKSGSTSLLTSVKKMHLNALALCLWRFFYLRTTKRPYTDVHRLCEVVKRHTSICVLNQFRRKLKILLDSREKARAKVWESYEFRWLGKRVHLAFIALSVTWSSAAVVFRTWWYCFLLFRDNVAVWTCGKRGLRENMIL